MSTMVFEVYDALKAAGAPEDKAQAAATALANFGQLATKADLDDGFKQVDAHFSRAEADVTSVKIELAVVKTELALVKWLISGIGFGVLLLVIKSFWPVH